VLLRVRGLSMKPNVICLMAPSEEGRNLPSHWTLEGGVLLLSYRIQNADPTFEAVR
jgi:hypothetical protein